MSEPFLSSDDYDERAHQLYNEGQYDEAIEALRTGLGLYPHAVELHVGMGYARLAREEYLWARRAFEQAIGLDPDHEDALAGLGEVLLKFGDRAGAVACFDRILALGFRDDHDLMLQVGRALFREAVLDQARRFFEVALTAHPDSAEAAACVGYAAHRLSDEADALYWLRRALELDADQGEARIYLANLLYDRGEYEAALFHLERTEPEDHFDGLAIWRLIELKKSVYRLPDADPELAPWHRRLDDLVGDAAPDDLLLAEIEAMGPDGRVRDPGRRAPRPQRDPPREHARRRHVRRHVGRNRAADEGRRRRVGRRLTGAVHGRHCAAWAQADGHRDPGDGPGELPQGERGRGAASDTSLRDGKRPGKGEGPAPPFPGLLPASYRLTSPCA